MALSTFHKVHPEGDVILLFEENVKADQRITTISNPQTARFRISSSKMALASPKFQTLDAAQRSAQATSQSPRLVVFPKAPNPDLTAGLLTVLKLIHGKQQEVPQKPDFKEMVHIASAAHIFECADALKCMHDSWFPNREYQRDDPFQMFDVGCQKGPGWLYVAWVLRHAQCFEDVTAIMIEWSNSLPETHLPLPQALIDDVNERRLHVFGKLAGEISKLRQEAAESRICGICDNRHLKTINMNIVYGDLERHLMIPGDGSRVWSLLMIFEELIGECRRVECSGLLTRLKQFLEKTLPMRAGFRLLDDGGWDKSIQESGDKV